MSDTILHEVAVELHAARQQHGLQHDLPLFGDLAWSSVWHATGDAIEHDARQALADDPSWAAIMAEEVGEALQERDPARLRAELIQVAAMAVGMIDRMDRGPTMAEVLHDAHADACGRLRRDSGGPE